MQTLVRSMPDLHKTLIVANHRSGPDQYSRQHGYGTCTFSYKKVTVDVGGRQRKKKKAKVDQSNGQGGETTQPSSEITNEDAQIES
jgi:hypothetical protein